MEKYQVTVKGSVQLNGVIVINKSFITDEIRVAQSFVGSKRYEVIEGWVKVNYPGAKITSIRSFAASMKVIKDEEEKPKTSWWKF